MVGQIDDLSLLWTVNRSVWLVDEARHPLREPVISAGLLELPVHSLLNDDPMGLVGDDEAMQIKLETVLHSGAVDLGDQTADRGELGSIEPHSIADGD